MLGLRLEAASADAVIESAGLLESGAPAAPHALAVMAARGLDLAGHRSQRIDAAVVDGADLVLGMERRHIREAVALAPRAWPRAFTLKELVRRATPLGPRPVDETLRRWLARVHADRRPEDLLAENLADEIADPYGGPPEGYVSTARELDVWLRRLVAQAWPR